eukprot:1802684-Amphidinium_carterae.1
MMPSIRLLEDLWYGSIQNKWIQGSRETTRAWQRSMNHLGASLLCLHYLIESQQCHANKRTAHIGLSMWTDEACYIVRAMALTKNINNYRNDWHTVLA